MKTSRKLTFLVLCLTTLTFVEYAHSLRLCGRRLSDALNFICEQYGGFHTPASKRVAGNTLINKRAFDNIAHAIFRRTVESSTSDSGGVADECCKKECSVSTLISYCGDIEINDSDIRLPEILTQLEELNGNETYLDSLQNSAIISNKPISEESESTSTNSQNLGLFRRNRPVFIVLQQSQEETSPNLEEYRF